MEGGDREEFGIAGAAGEAAVSRFGLLVTHGTFYTAGVQLSSVAVVLPFICAQQGLFWAAGLLYPAFTIGIVMGNAMSPFILHWSRDLKHFVLAAAAVAMAALVVCNAVVALTRVLVGIVFLSTSWAIGAVSGITSVAFSDVVSAKLPEVRRGDLMLTQGAFGSVVAAVITLLVVPVLARSDRNSSEADLLWLGAAALAAGGIAAVFVGPMRSAAKTTKPRPMRDTYLEGLAVARSHRWFRRYALTQLLFVPISLGTTFYSLRASEAHGDKPGSLHALVVYSSVGLVAGSVVWRIIYRVFGVRGMLLGSALVSSAAALVCIVAERSGEWSHLWTYGVVFLLATVASQAIFAATISWISVFATEHHRATLISLGALLVAVESSVLGAALGAIALKDSLWPILVVLTLNVLAAAWAVGAPTRPGAGRQQDHSVAPPQTPPTRSP